MNTLTAEHVSVLKGLYSSDPSVRKSVDGILAKEEADTKRRLERLTKLRSASSETSEENGNAEPTEARPSQGTRGRPRNAPGTKSFALLEWLKKHPGSTVAEAANGLPKAAKMNPKQVNTYLNSMFKNGDVVRDGERGSYTYSAVTTQSAPISQG